MKDIISIRASNALQGTPYTKENAPAIVALIDFAAQAPGLDFGNYGDPLAYRQEARGILHDWKMTKGALHECAQLGVTDQMVIEAAPRAFSGRLEWIKECHSTATNRIGPEWVYTTGQYWPTEYRKAAAAVLEHAVTTLRQNRPPTAQMPTTIGELKALARENGNHWFDRETMRSFGTRIESGIIGECYFITSEQHMDGPRKFTVRKFDATGEVDTVGEFCGHDTIHQARECVRMELRKPKPVAA